MKVTYGVSFDLHSLFFSEKGQKSVYRVNPLNPLVAAWTIFSFLPFARNLNVLLLKCFCLKTIKKSKNVFLSNNTTFKSCSNKFAVTGKKNQGQIH